MQRQAGAWNKIGGLNGCGGNRRSQNGESELETAEPAPEARPTGARVFGRRSCTTPLRVQPPEASNLYASAERQLIPDDGRCAHKARWLRKHFRRKHKTRARCQISPVGQLQSASSEAPTQSACTCLSRPGGPFRVTRRCCRSSPSSLLQPP